MTQHDHHRNCHHRLYRLTCPDFDALYEYAKGCCQICQTPEVETTRGKLVIDHAPGYAWIAVRGLLCDKCNKLMGYADAGRYEPLSFPYLREAWFVRTLTDRYRATLPEDVQRRCPAERPRQP